MEGFFNILLWEIRQFPDKSKLFVYRMCYLPTHGLQNIVGEVLCEAINIHLIKVSCVLDNFPVVRETHHFHHFIDGYGF